jgi:hypothetical protein
MNQNGLFPLFRPVGFRKKIKPEQNFVSFFLTGRFKFTPDMEKVSAKVSGSF